MVPQGGRFNKHQQSKTQTETSESAAERPASTQQKLSAWIGATVRLNVDGSNKSILDSPEAGQ